MRASKVFKGGKTKPPQKNYKEVVKLLKGKKVKVAGVTYERVMGEFEPGDLYLAQRNDGPILLIVKEINRKKYWIVPTDPTAYVFDIHECVKVRRVK